MISPDVPAGQTARDHGAPDALSDAVVVSPALAGEVFAALSAYVTERVRITGGLPSPACYELLRSLYAAARRPARPALGSADGTTSAPSATVEPEMTATEVAGQMGASPEYVRRLCREGRLRARRPGHEWLIERGPDGRAVREDRPTPP